MMRHYLHIYIIIINVMADCKEILKINKSVGQTACLLLKNGNHETNVKWSIDGTLLAKLENKKTLVRYPNEYDLNPSDGSLTIKNVNLNHSGTYRVATGEWEEERASYHLKVHDAVSKPQINLDQTNVSTPCQVLVICSANGNSVTFQCDHQHCTQVNISETKVNFTVTIKHGMLECSASNHGSTKSTSITLSNRCSELTTKPNEAPYLFWIVFSFIIVIMLGAIICFIIKIKYSRKSMQNEDQEEKNINTTYSVVNKSQKKEAPAESSGEHAVTTVYDVPTKSVRSKHFAFREKMQYNHSWVRLLQCNSV